MSQDPICGAWVDEKQNDQPRSEFEGQSYFCSQDCKQEFDDDPERYVGWGGTTLSGSA